MASGKKWKEQQKRIMAVFQGRTEDTGRGRKTLQCFKQHLEDRLVPPVTVTGVEDFSREEFYVLRPGDKGEYEVLKKMRPSYTDVFRLLRIEKEHDDFFGLFGRVVRLSDKKRFTIPLEQLKAAERESPEYELLNDYSVWFVNS
jgi:hypothetical protein